MEGFFVIKNIVFFKKISLLCQDYLKSSDINILDDIKILVLDGFNLLEKKDNMISDKVNKISKYALDEKSFFKQVISNSLSNFDNNFFIFSPIIIIAYFYSFENHAPLIGNCPLLLI